MKFWALVPTDFEGGLTDLQAKITQPKTTFQVEPKVLGIIGPQTTTTSGPTSTDTKQTIADIENKLNAMTPAVKAVIADDEKWMKIALITIPIFVAVGLSLLIYSVVYGKVDLTSAGSGGAGTLFCILTSAPYTRYDKARKEKNYYEVLIPGLTTELAACEASASTTDLMTCCSNVVDEIRNLLKALREIAGTTEEDESDQGSKGSSTSTGPAANSTPSTG